MPGRVTWMELLAPTGSTQQMGPFYPTEVGHSAPTFSNDRSATYNQLVNEDQSFTTEKRRTI